MNHETRPTYKHKPKQHRAELKAERIIDAANRLFSELGYRNTTIRMIAEQAEVSTGSLYHIFPDKSAIARIISMAYANDAVDVFAELGRSVTSFEDVEPAIRQFVQGAVELRSRHPGYYAISRIDNPSRNDVVTHSVRSIVVSTYREKLTKTFSISDINELDRVLGIASETVRHFLDITPPAAPDFKAQIFELEELVAAYLVKRIKQLIT